MAKIRKEYNNTRTSRRKKIVIISYHIMEKLKKVKKQEEDLEPPGKGSKTQTTFRIFTFFPTQHAPVTQSF